MKKIKGSSDAVKLKYLLFVFAASILAALPIRVYQLLALVDPTNGFFAEKDVTVYVLYAAIVLFIVLFLALSYVSREVPSPKLPTGKNPILGITSIIMAVAMAWDIVSIEKTLVPSTQTSTAIFFSLLKTNLAEKGAFFLLLQFVFAFFATIYFVIFATSHLNGKASYKEYKLLALSPLCWAITRLIARLLHAISFLRVSELLFEIFMLVFLMLFFMTFARISSGVFTDDTMWGIYGYGLSASLFAALVTIPRLVMIVVGKDAVVGNSFNPADLACLVFVLSYIFASLGVGFKDGLKNRKTVSEVELPSDDEAVTKRTGDAPAAVSVDNISFRKTASNDESDMEDDSEAANDEYEAEVKPEAEEVPEASYDEADDTDASAVEASFDENDAKESDEEPQDAEEAEDAKLSRKERKLLKKEQKRHKKEEKHNIDDEDDEVSEPEKDEEYGEDDSDDGDDDSAPSAISLADLKNKNKNN